MKFIKCKNEMEKLQAIKNYCSAQIKENNYNIEWLKANRKSSLDYADEINELENKNADFNKIIEIINADELTSILID